MKLFSKKEARHQPKKEWRTFWQSLVPAENRDVPITVDGETRVAYICINHYAMMLQDGLLMEASFFDVCEHFQRAGYHVIWLMRCTQDIRDGYLKQGKKLDGGARLQWIWKSPTTNFGRWMSDQRRATILLQYREVEEEDPLTCEENILQRVVWAESDDDAEMVPGRTVFTTVGTPGTPVEMLRMLRGERIGG